jgi:hypothetical protein
MLEWPKFFEEDHISEVDCTSLTMIRTKLKVSIFGVWFTVPEVHTR